MSVRACAHTCAGSGCVFPRNAGRDIWQARFLVGSRYGRGMDALDALGFRFPGKQRKPVLRDLLGS